jgi:GTP-sensing pleiotropic transcriptional regulator CodY
VANESHIDPHALALAALAATLGDARRAQRFIDLTGIGTDELRRRAGDAALLAALIRFLEAHEPDLVAVSDELGVSPAVLVDARRTLESEGRR